MSNIIIDKYGGSSITSQEDIERIRRITDDDKRRKIIVVSAPGIPPNKKNNKNYKKVTDLSIIYSQTKDPSILEDVARTYSKIYPDIGEQKFIEKLEIILEQGKDLQEAAFTDFLKARWGEALNSQLLAEAIDAQWVDPKELFLVTSEYGKARIVPESKKMIRQRFKSIENSKTPFVIAGFYGVTKQGRIATFRRGGSDSTQTNIAAALNASLCENFTDKDAMYTADPDLIKIIFNGKIKPKKIKELTFDELRDLSYSGFDIFQADSIQPLKQARIPVHIRGTFEYPQEGTYAFHERITNPNEPITGVAYKKGFLSFKIWKTGLNDETGIGKEILEVFAKRGINYFQMPNLVDDVSVVLERKQISDNFTLNNILSELYSVVGGQAEISVLENRGCLAVVGKGLENNIERISSETLGLFADNGIKVGFISTGEERRCIIYGINEEDSEKAIKSIFNKYNYLKEDL